MKKSIIISGLVAGVIATTWTIAGMVGLKVEGSLPLGYSTMIVAFSLIFVSVKNYRDKQNGGIITFGAAFKMGLLITLIASTIYVGVWLIDYFYFDSDYLDQYLAHEISQLKASGATAAQIKQQTESLRSLAAMYRNPFINALFTYREIMPVGLVVTLACALILKRKENTETLMATE